VKLAPAFVMIVGFLIALQAYVRNKSLPERFVGQFGILYRFLYQKWFFDEIYNVLFVRPSLWLGRFFWKRGDEGTIDRFGPTARRPGGGRQRPYRAAPDRLSLHLRAGDAPRPRRRRYLGDGAMRAACVMPAKAGISGPDGTASPPETPAFAGVTGGES
jgi:hypothetical protein